VVLLDALKEKEKDVRTCQLLLRIIFMNVKVGSKIFSFINIKNESNLKIE